MTEWIKCEDRLPAKFDYYLTYDANHKFVSKNASHEILKYRPKEKCWWWYKGMNQSIINNVTHWMPLPKAPK
jgi:hypothetical protein